MKILITSPNLDPVVNVSGISSIVRLIVDHNKINEYIHFELGKRDGEKRNLFWFVRILRALLSWTNVLITDNIDFVHFNLALNKRSIIRDTPFILISRMFHKKMLIHLHGGEFLLGEPSPFWVRAILKNIYSSSVPKIVLSSIEMLAIQSKYSVRNMLALPNFIFLEESNVYKRIFSNKSKLSILFLGRITESKGIHQILEALIILKKRGLNFIFTMAGKGPNEKKYAARFTEVLGTNFKFAGIVTGKEKSKLLQSCDVFVLPSLFEGLPMALLECMSFGLVPIVTDVGSMGTVVKNGKTGIIVRENSANDIANAFEGLINDRKLLKTLSCNAREFIVSNFNPTTYFEKLNRIYEDV